MTKLIHQLTHKPCRLILSLMLGLFAHAAAFGQTQASDTTESKLKFADKIGHWLVAYGISSPDFMDTARSDFKSRAFAQVYIEGIIDHDAWMFNLLNRITKFRYQEKQTPNIVFEVKFQPENKEVMDSYKLVLSVRTNGNERNDLTRILDEVAAEHISSTRYPDPEGALIDIENTIQAALDGIAEKLGTELAPDLMMRYQNEIFWDGHEIPVMEDEGNFVEIESVNKNGELLSDSEVIWTNADPFGSKGVVDLTGIGSKEVTLMKRSDSTRMTVLVKRFNATEDINDLLKELIVEALTAKKQEALVAIPILKQDSAGNLQQIIASLEDIEASNFPLDNVGVRPKALYENPILADSSVTLNDNVKRTSFGLLIGRKAIRNNIRKKLNVVAFADLVVDHPERINDVLDALLVNSGRLIARLVLNRDRQGQRDAVRNIVVDFLNENLERIAGVNSPLPPVGEMPPLPVIAATPNGEIQFRPGQFLYVSKYVSFPGLDTLKVRLENYLQQLDTPMVVVINYSQDISDESFIARTNATRPRGIPPGYKYKTFTFFHVPGSVLAGLALSDDENSEYERSEATQHAEVIEEKVVGEGFNYGIAHMPTNLLNTGGRSYTFMSPAGTLVILPSTQVSNLVFSYGMNTINQDYVVPGTLLGFKVGQTSYTANALPGAFVYVANEGAAPYKVEDHLNSTDIDNGKKTAIMLLPTGENQISFAKFSVEGLNLPVEDGTYRDYVSVSDFRFKPYLNNNFIKSETYDLRDIPEDLFDLRDHRQELTESVFYFIKEDYGQSHLLLKLKAAEYYALHPIVFTSFYNSIISSLSDEAKALRALESDKIEYWKRFLILYKTHLTNTQNNLAELLKLENLPLDMGGAAWENLFFLMGPDDYYNLNYDQRIRLLRISSRIWSHGNGDKFVRNLVVLTNESDRLNLLNGLVSEKDGAGQRVLIETLLRDFFGVDGAEFSEMVTELTNWIWEYYPPSENFDYPQAVRDKLYIRINSDFFDGDIMVDRFNDQGDIVLDKVWSSDPEVVAHPFKYVIVENDSDFTTAGHVIAKGAKLTMPALFAYMVFNNINTYNVIKGARLTFDVLLLYVGVTQLNYALQAGSTYLLVASMADIGMSLADFSIVAYEQELMLSQAGRDFLDAWGNIILAYGIARVGSDIFYVAMLRMETNLGYLATEGRLTQGQLRELTTAKDLLKGRLGLSTSADDFLTRANAMVEIADDAVVLGLGQSMTTAKTYLANVSRLEGAVDIVVHGNQTQFYLIVNGVEVAVNHRALATWIRTNNYHNATIRLMSCSGAVSAQNLANSLNQAVISTNDAVRIFEDGGITTSQGLEWYRYTPGNATPQLVTKPRPPTSLSAPYVELGNAVNRSAEVQSNIINNIDELEGLAEKTSSGAGLTNEEQIKFDELTRVDEAAYSDPTIKIDEAYRQKMIEKRGGKGRPTKDWKKQNIGTNISHAKIKTELCQKLEALGIQPNQIRVNQAQTDPLNNALGLNRPDINFTFQGRRYYVEIDALSSPRGIPHRNRILRNDSGANLTREQLPEALKAIELEINGKKLRLEGSITLWQFN